MATLPLFQLPHLPGNSPNLPASNFDHLVHIFLSKGLRPKKDAQSETDNIFFLTHKGHVFGI